MPADDKSSPWESDGPILISLVVSTDPVNYEDAEIIGDVQELVVEWTDASIARCGMKQETMNFESSRSQHSNTNKVQTLAKKLEF